MSESQTIAQHRQPGSLLRPVRHFVATLFQEQLDPGHAAAAVFLGIFIANVPIYGFQSLSVIGLAVLLKLNKPVAFAATFVNNPLLQPFLVISSVELGHFLRTGHFLRWSMNSLSVHDLQSHFWTWLLGSITLGMLLGAIGATLVFLILRWRTASRCRACARFVNAQFAKCSYFDRGFVRWKMRLDRIFDMLATEELGEGPVVDLGCGYGPALGFVGCRTPGRRLIGCDLDARRISAARKAFGNTAEFAVCDMRAFDIPQAGLILIMDVLQYLAQGEQRLLLERCGEALRPGGKLIFRVPDTSSGLRALLSRAFDRLIFFLHRAAVPPVVLSPAEYQLVLNGAGLRLDERRIRNRLPLSHRLFVATKPLN